MNIRRIYRRTATRIQKGPAWHVFLWLLSLTLLVTASIAGPSATVVAIPATEFRIQHRREPRDRAQRKSGHGSCNGMAQRQTDADPLHTRGDVPHSLLSTTTPCHENG